MDTNLSQQSRTAFLKVRTAIIAGFLLAAFGSAAVARIIPEERIAQGR
jgi:hypothetical protein